MAPSAVFLKLANFACHFVNPAGMHKRTNLKRDYALLESREVVVRSGGTTMTIFFMMTRQTRWPGSSRRRKASRKS